jgi:hypothetical protein
MMLRAALLRRSDLLGQIPNLRRGRQTALLKIGPGRPSLLSYGREQRRNSLIGESLLDGGPSGGLPLSDPDVVPVRPFVVRGKLRCE